MLQDPFINIKSGLRSFGMLGWGLDNIQNSNKQGPPPPHGERDFGAKITPGGYGALPVLFDPVGLCRKLDFF